MDIRTYTVYTYARSTVHEHTYIHCVHIHYKYSAWTYVHTYTVYTQYKNSAWTYIHTLCTHNTSTVHGHTYTVYTYTTDQTRPLTSPRCVWTGLWTPWVPGTGRSCCGRPPGDPVLWCHPAPRPAGVWCGNEHGRVTRHFARIHHVIFTATVEHTHRTFLSTTM